MYLIPDIVAQQKEMISWRHDLHQHPEVSFKEKRTSDKVADLLRSFGFEVEVQSDPFFVVGRLQNGEGPSIGLFAQLDAYAIEEKNPGLEYASQNEGVMHCAGHDGEMTMMLGAAQYLASSQKFHGTITFFFYSSYGNNISVRSLIEDGLFERHPVDVVYTLKNSTGLDQGYLGISSGPVVSAVGELFINLVGKGGHPAFPQNTKDPILAATAIINLLEKLIARLANPVNSILVAITAINAGSSYSKIPETLEMIGSVRFLNQDIEKWLPTQITELVQKISASFGVEALVSYRLICPSMINDADQARIARRIIVKSFGRRQIAETQPPIWIGSEFAHFLQVKPGAAIFIGNGLKQNSVMSNNYDFNDDILPYGASVLCKIVEYYEELAKENLSVNK